MSLTPCLEVPSIIYQYHIDILFLIGVSKATRPQNATVYQLLVNHCIGNSLARGQPEKRTIGLRIIPKRIQSVSLGCLV
jgi:hypothetical protein